jgi:DNA-binding NtrC family response regulator
MVEASPAQWGIIGRSAAMRDVAKRIEIFAAREAPILVIGETGTGKELVARAIHRGGPRAKNPFVAVACGAIPTDLAESELFGHERGAFTGATERRLGTFERAHGGTLLLDDVDDLPLAVQVKLLRVLQEGTYERVGGQRELCTDVRVIATTKIDLEEAVRSDSFREDLYYRLKGLEIQLPPLRERSEDLLLLVGEFLRRAANRQDRPVPTLAPSTVELLRRHVWHGNVRELDRTIEAAVTLCDGDRIEPIHLPPSLRRTPAQEARPFTLHLEGCEGVAFTELMRDFERELLDWAMARAGGRQTQAAALLGLARTTLQSRLGRADD